MCLLESFLFDAFKKIIIECFGFDVSVNAFSIFFYLILFNFSNKFIYFFFRIIMFKLFSEIIFLILFYLFKVFSTS